MLSSAAWSLLELSLFFIVAIGLGLHQLWSLKKYALKQLERDNAARNDEKPA